MKRITAVALLSLALTGCYKTAPSEQEAIDIAKKEVSMAVCGDRSVSCVDISGGKVNIGPRRDDHTNQIIVTFKSIKTNGELNEQESAVGKVDAGMVKYDFDATNGKTYIKDISLWSEDGKHSIELCGHDYKFCKE
ncbi:hypothetical protein Q2T70_03565 [Klebsiella oxytoca]|uniref:hypothetical protein n=1 Tax=Klebsiella oxytoca TaxID=571 RepID=UPI00265DCE37|nr:hypothetical protein [Klebsiella oxytoca]WKM72841.1 hypothetical protein Q2T70_03565 [Klebsiella oxytoca]